MSMQQFCLHLAGLFLPAILVAQVKPLTIGPITAQPGAIASAMIEIPAAADAATRIPVTVMHGSRPGPVLALIAENHGYEYPPVLALQRLRAAVKPSEIAGSLILVHVANLPSCLDHLYLRNR